MVSTLALLVPTLLAPSAAAQDAGIDECDEIVTRGPLAVTPATGASAVTLDAYVRVEYSEGYFALGIDPEEAIDLRFCDGLSVVECETLGEPVAGTVQVIGDTLFFLPARNFMAGEEYAGIARGIDLDLGIAFRTGSTVDSAPPVMSDVDAPTTARVDPSCEAPEGGYRVDVSFAPATDDGSPGSIEYLLYFTRGAGLEAPELRRRARNFSTELVTMAFVLSPEEAVSPGCVVVHAVDGVGNVDDDMEPECFEPVQGNFFEPLCSAGPMRGRSWFGWSLPALVLLRRRRAP